MLTLHNIGKGIASGAEEQENRAAAGSGGGAGEGGEAAASGAVNPEIQQNGAGGEGSTTNVAAERKRLSMNDGEAVEGE